MDNDKEVQKLLEKVKAVEKGERLDLSSDEDLSIAIMNLISIEEHLFFSGAKTGKEKYYELLHQVREMRKTLLKKIIKNYEGEEWCLPPETIVFCNPEPKTIDKISKNEKILTATGEFQPVKETFVRHYEGELVSVQPYYSDCLSITPEHPVLCVTGYRRKQVDLWRKNFSEPKIVWRKAKELTDTDFLLFPRYKEEKDVENLEIEYSWKNEGCFRPTTFIQKKVISVNRDLLRLIGFYISEGSISEGEFLYNRFAKTPHFSAGDEGKTRFQASPEDDSKAVESLKEKTPPFQGGEAYKNHKRTRAALYFSFGKHEGDLIEQTKYLFKKVFGFSPWMSETHSTTDLICNRRIVVNFFKQFGKKSSEKELPFWVLGLPSEKLFPLIYGLIKGDGNEDRYKISYFTVSHKLAFQLRMILFKMGIIHSLKKRLNLGGEVGGRKIIARLPGFEIAISGDSARALKAETGLEYDCKKTSGNFGYVLDRYVMIPIKKIDRVYYKGEVYNLRTETETYTTFAGIVHNCVSKHLLAGCMRLMEVGTKSLTKGEKKEAEEFFQMAYSLYSLFWGLNLKLLKTSELTSAVESEPKDDNPKGFMTKLGEVIKKAIDCCRE